MTAAAFVSVVLTAAGSLNLQPLLDRLASEQDVPGLSAVVTRRDEVLYAGGSGVADIESGRPMTADTVLYAGSLSKILTAVLTLRLVDEGTLSLDDHVEGIAEADDTDVRLDQLLTHTSGLEREGDFGYWFSGAFPDGKSLGRFLAATSLLSPPGERVRYSNIGYAALGLAIEAATGRSYHEALRHYVLEPLGMQASGSPGPAVAVARGYTPKGRMIPSAERPFAGVGKRVGERNLREYHDAKAMTPAFGVYTTAADLGRLARFLLGYDNAGLLSGELRQSVLIPQNGNRSYGMSAGRWRDRPVVRHSGWFAAHKSHVLIEPGAEVAVIVLANSDDADPGAVAGRLLEAVLDSDAAVDSVN